VDPEALSGGEAAYGYVENRPLVSWDGEGRKVVFKGSARDVAKMYRALVEFFSPYLRNAGKHIRLKGNVLQMDRLGVKAFRGLRKNGVSVSAKSVAGLYKRMRYVAASRVYVDMGFGRPGRGKLGATRVKRFRVVFAGRNRAYLGWTAPLTIVIRRSLSGADMRLVVVHEPVVHAFQLIKYFPAGDPRTPKLYDFWTFVRGFFHGQHALTVQDEMKAKLPRAAWSGLQAIGKWREVAAQCGWSRRTMPDWVGLWVERVAKVGEVERKQRGEK